MLSHSLACGRVPDGYADITRKTQFGGQLTPLHEIAAPRIDRLPGDLQRQLQRQFYTRIEAAPDWSEHYAAQQWIADEVASLEAERLDVAFDDTEIRARADRAASLCSRMPRLEGMQEYACSQGIEPPEVSEKRSRVGCAKRLMCARWWRRQLRRCWTRQAETHLRRLGLVSRRRQLYASDRAVAWRRGRKRRDRQMLKELVAVSDCGEQLELWSIVEKSIANPAIRRAELMTRASGFETLAELAGHEAIFVTLTTPSAYHRTLKSGEPNPNYAGFSPRDGQQWLSKMWARARAKFARLSLMAYGIRVAEPHHDGTPHWHCLLFGRGQHLADVEKVLRLMWLSEYSEESGAKEHRTQFKAIRREVGSATGYIAKYLAKNLDGFNVGSDDESEKATDATETCDRVAAWASAHGVRQFAQVGGPSVSVWRELRRLRAGDVRDETIERARAAADAGDWSNFVTAVGGIEAGRKTNVRTWSERTNKLNAYDEVRGPQLVGVRSADDACHVRTRTKEWRIQRKASGASVESLTRDDGLTACVPMSSLGPVSITVRGDDAAHSTEVMIDGRRNVPTNAADDKGAMAGRDDPEEGSNAPSVRHIRTARTARSVGRSDRRH